MTPNPYRYAPRHFLVFTRSLPGDAVKPPRLVIAQRDMYDAQRALIVTRLAKAVNLVQLYQALGGGWKELQQS